MDARLRGHDGVGEPAGLTLSPIYAYIPSLPFTEGAAVHTGHVGEGEAVPRHGPGGS